MAIKHSLIKRPSALQKIPSSGYLSCSINVHLATCKRDLACLLSFPGFDPGLNFLNRKLSTLNGQVGVLSKFSALIQ